MKTVYEVHDNLNGFVFDSNSRAECEDFAVAWDAKFPDLAPHTMVERQVAGPEDTDELLRLRALVDEVREWADDKHFPFQMTPNLARQFLSAHGFGGES